MFIEPELGLTGTVGGGCGEAQVIEAASAVIETGIPRLERVELAEDLFSWSPAVCGGVFDVFIEPTCLADGRRLPVRVSPTDQMGSGKHREVSLTYTFSFLMQNPADVRRQAIFRAVEEAIAGAIDEIAERLRSRRTGGLAATLESALDRVRVT